MCDTLIALAGATARGNTLFAKNSDRERNEAQLVEMRSGARHPDGDSVALTYITIPQAQITHACLLCRPFWMWGAEMGANEHGLVIGNEAVHAVMPAQRKRALTGMDLVRLGLERAATAEEAVELMIALLERHGQGGDCGHLGRFYYHNSFLIADPLRAFVLETVGRWWAVEEVQTTRAISNALSIGATARLSPALADHAREEGWSDGDGRFDFAARLTDRARDALSFGGGRCARGSELMARRQGALTERGMMAILRDHGPEGGAGAEGSGAWRPADTVRRTICMHAAEGSRRSQTTGSLVSDLRPGKSVHWVTAGAAPCLSIFKPVLFAAGLHDQGPPPTDRFDRTARWWRHERLHRAVLHDFAPRAAAIVGARDALEAAFAQRMDIALAADNGPAALRAAVDECWREADAAEEGWLQNLTPEAENARRWGPYEKSWARLNQVAGMPSAPD